MSVHQTQTCCSLGHSNITLILVGFFSKVFEISS